jgi:uncharacterized protein YkwD
MKKTQILAFTALVLMLASCKRDQLNELELTPTISSVSNEGGADNIATSLSGRIDFQPATSTSTQQQEVLRLINQRRATGCNCGTKFYPKAPALTLDSRLNKAANVHATDMTTKNFFSHTGSDGSQPWDRIKRQGYNWANAGENIAAGYNSASTVVQGWINSPGHCANIMNPQFVHLGVGYSTGGSYRYYWVTNFARPR